MCPSRRTINETLRDVDADGGGKKKRMEFTNEPKGCGCWRAKGSMSDHQPLVIINVTNTLPPSMLEYTVQCKSVLKSDFIL